MRAKFSIVVFAGIVIFCLIIQSNLCYAQITVSVTPNQADVNINQTQQFVVTVSGTPNQGVTWSVIPNGPARHGPGLIGGTGLYTAPILPPSPPFVTIQATSVADPTKVGTATVIVRGVRNYTESNIDGDLSAMNGKSYVQFTWTELPIGTTRAILSRSHIPDGAWTQVAIIEDSRVLTDFRTIVHTDLDLLPPDTTSDYYYKIEAFSSSNQLLKTYSPVFLPRSTF